MANVKISDLTAATGVADANEFEINEAGSSKKVTGSQISSYVRGDIVTADISDVSVTATELSYVEGVTSAIQTQLDGKAATSHTHTVSDVTDLVELSQAQVEDDTDTTFGLVSGERLGQAVAANASGVFSETYTSSEQSIVDGGSITLAHGLSSTPVFIFAYLVCKTAEDGYSVGEVYGPFTVNDAPGNVSTGVSIVADSTNLNIRVGADGFGVIRKTDGVGVSINSSNFNLVFRAWA